MILLRSSYKQSESNLLIIRDFIHNRQRGLEPHNSFERQERPASINF